MRMFCGNDLQQHIMRITCADAGGAFIVFDSISSRSTCVDMGYISKADGIYHLCPMTQANMKIYFEDLVAPRSSALRQEVTDRAHAHAQESQWHMWRWEDVEDTRAFVIFIQQPLPSEHVFKRGLFAVAQEMWLNITNVDCVWEKNMAFAQFTGKTEQLVRLHTTMLPDGTKVTFKLRKPR